MVRIYPLARWLASTSLIAYLILRIFTPPSQFSELILYNFVLLATIFSILASPLPDDDLGQRSVAAAIFVWGIGSITSSIDSYFQTELSLYSEFAYVSFYPLMLFGIVRSLRQQAKSRALEILDTFVIALSGTTLLASFLLKPASAGISGSQLEVFLAIIYPIGDLLLFLTVVAILAIAHLTPRKLLMMIGITIFTSADFYYLWQSQNATYQFGSLSDVGWLLAFLFISQAFWYPTDEESHPRSFNPVLVTLALILSSLVLAIAVLRPDYFPRFVLIPAFATIALAFIRMAVAMSDARRMSDEQILARTDELTGLANRRRFLSEYEDFQRKSGSLLILDLDGFKPVNDRLGHEVGDQLLTQVARRFERVMPKGGLLARLGGDEFGALIPGDEGLEVARALRATLSYPFEISGNGIQLGVSVGIAECTPDLPGNNLLRRADEAMYQAKRTRSGVAIWEESIMSSGL